MDLGTTTTFRGPDGEPLTVGGRYFRGTISVAPQYTLVCDAVDNTAWHCEVPISGVVVHATPGESSIEGSLEAAEAWVNQRVIELFRG